MNFATKMINWMLMRPRRQGSTKESRAAFLPPQDVLASILVRLPGSDLRRLRRVCKEWRDIISDPTFIQEHMVYEPKLTPSHTMVFFPGFAYGSRQDPHNGRGFLFDEHWRLKAEFTAGRWDDLIGACNGLLCFLDAGQGPVKIVEPRYKIVHHNYLKYSSPREGEAIDDEELHVYTVGGGKGWRRLHVAHEVHGKADAHPFYVDGVVYWPTASRRPDEKLVRFDLATEKITSEVTACLRLKFPWRDTAVFCRLVDYRWTTSCLMTMNLHCQWDAWFPGAQEGSFPGACVLLNHRYDDGLYLATMNKNLELGERKLLFEVGKKQPTGHKYINGPASLTFVPRHQQLPLTGTPPSEQSNARTTVYDPTVSAAPLALYLGTPSPSITPTFPHA
ncbi:unnamed protein product [Alopecurus aequalis]